MGSLACAVGLTSFAPSSGSMPRPQPILELFAALIHPDDSDWVNQRYRAAYDPAG